MKNDILYSSQYSRGNPAALVHAVAALGHTVIRYREIWWFLALQDIRSRFRRSRLGLLWMIGHQLAFAIGGGLIWSALFGARFEEFVPFLACGFAVWAFMASGFVDGCNAFIAAQGFAKQVALPLQIYVVRHVVAAGFSLLIGVATAMSIVLVLRGPAALLALPLILAGMGLLALVVLAAAGTFAYAGAIYGDIWHAMASLFQMLFVISPVIYPPALLEVKGLGFALAANPLASLLAIVREPVVNGHAASFHDYAVTLALLAALALLYALIDTRVGRRVVYYL